MDNNELKEVSFDELENVEDVLTGGVFGLIVCCNDGGSNGNAKA